MPEEARRFGVRLWYISKCSTFTDHLQPELWMDNPGGVMANFRKLAFLSCILLVGLVIGAGARGDTPGNQRQASSNELAPSPLEAFAERSTAKLVWSKPVGVLESTESRATVMSIAVEDASTAPQMKRGVRIDLKHLMGQRNCDVAYTAWRVLCERPNAAIYIEEEQLDKVSESLIRFGTAELRKWEFISNFWAGVQPPSPPTGVIIGGYSFGGRQASDLGKLLINARA